jgi:predicted negative regulator of RcsB-dependent stress response
MSNKKQDPMPPQNLNPDSDLPPDADMEERFNEFWKKNGATIFGGIVLGAAIVIGIQVYQHLGNKKEQAIRDSFAAAATVEQKAQFAAEHADHQLGGLAQLQVADARYQEGAFAAAAELYDAASKIFEDPTLASRARLGQGMSLLRAGSADAGRAVLQAVALNGGALDQTRGEAAYHLAVSYWEVGDTAKALEVTDVILQLDSAPFWVFRANALRERLGADAVVAGNS